MDRPLSRPGFPGGSPGFTLMELLVSIALIAVLASLLLPAIRRVHLDARRANCSNQLRQMGIASQLYREDFGDRFFPYYQTTGQGTRRYWFGLAGDGPEGQRFYDASGGFLHPYLGGPRIQLCPSFPYGRPFVKLKFEGASHGYGYNIHLAPRQESRPAWSIRKPSSILLFGDAAQLNDFQFPASRTNPLLEEFYLIGSGQRTLHFRHHHTASVIFLDGHTASLDLKSAFAPADRIHGHLLAEPLPSLLLPH